MGWILLRYAVRSREWLGRGGRARAGRPVGPRRRFGPKSQIQIRISFSFSNLFYKLQINLNSNQI
jgi:hypothetical protein